ncbi:hypothetical protein [Sansalvadorimonas verongulae]|uniref:hypothetical protein n=1 Tax=Sansalvadorimonas verongulae TaxID=2172824 RepID=UPI0012BCF363|nr:hypothetical protein [Sansalvadorimonas verongulae]MTI12704.1 hypothetical protein [Sansalvadorimonas verongulae]
MDALEELIRLSSDSKGLRKYLESHHVTMDKETDWDDFLKNLDRVLDAVEQLPDPQLKAIKDEAVRIANMAQPGPQVALLEFFQKHKTFLSLKSQLDRSRWVFTYEPERFSAAEAYFDFSQSRGKVSRCQLYEGVPGPKLLWYLGDVHIPKAGYVPFWFCRSFQGYERQIENICREKQRGILGFMLAENRSEISLPGIKSISPSFGLPAHP